MATNRVSLSLSFSFYSKDGFKNESLLLFSSTVLLGGTQHKHSVTRSYFYLNEDLK
jgi:hypothetical protein